MIDLGSYFERIGYRGERAATLDTLRASIARHTEAIAFENLNPLLGRPVPLDAAELEKKLVRDRRGGYCFEQNLLLGHVLQALGFAVSGLAARVLWNVPESVTPPRGHMLLRVELEGTTHLADVGFGGLTPTAPLRLESDFAQSTPHEPFRLLTAGTEWVLQAMLREEWRPVYRFDLQPQQLPDYEVINWYLSNHPGSRFVANLVVARPTKDGRYALLNNEFTAYRRDGTSERRSLGTVAELRVALEERFLLRLPDWPDLDARLARVIEGR